MLRLDTPGGLVSATRDMIGAILASPVPVVVFVAPSGARAASAGTYIVYASHIAAMAPGTNLGAATPVQIGAPPGPTPQPRRDGDKPESGSGAGAMERKILNDAVAYMRSLAQLRGRNAEWAEKAVREAATLTAEEALTREGHRPGRRQLADLLERLDGRKVRTADGEHVLATRHARVLEVEPDWKSRLLAVITDPNVAFILLMIGVYGIIFEFWNPGLVGPGVVGGICLLVGLIALSVLPVNLAGLGLLVLGIGLMAAEAFTPGFGVLGIGGVVSFVLGAVFLFDPAGADIDFAVAWPVIVGAAVTSAAVRRPARHDPARAPPQGGDRRGTDDRPRGRGGRLGGRPGPHPRPRRDLGGARRRSAGTGQPVRVERRDGLTLHVVEPREGT